MNWVTWRQYRIQAAIAAPCSPWCWSPPA